MSNQEWRVLDGEGNDQGPYSVQDLQGYYASGNITHDTLVWTEGLAEWTSAGQVEGLLPPAPEAPLATAIPAPAAYAAQPAAPPVPPRQGPPLWLSVTTLVIGVASLIFFFFPWVSASVDFSLGTSPKMVKAFTQSGFQSITTDISVPNEFVSQTSKMMADLLGVDEEEIKESLKEDIKNEDDKDWGSSVLVLIAMIAIGIAVIAVLIGLTNKLSSLVIIAQSLLAVAAVLIGIQMATQFPVTRSFAEVQEENKKEIINAQKEMAKMRKAAEENGTEVPAALNGTDQAREVNLYETSFEPSCFVTVGLLSLSILLVVVTISSASSTPLIIPQGNYQSSQSPQQPQQPGSGLRFH